MHTNDVLKLLFDDNSFMQIGAGENENITIGYGTVQGKLVYAFGQNDQIHNGVCTASDIERMLRAYRMAVRSKAPLIGIFHSNGLVLNQGMEIMERLGELYCFQKEQAAAIPQYMIVNGPCGGGLALAAAMGDFVFVSEESGDYFINPPDTRSKTIAATADADIPSGNEQVASRSIDLIGSIQEISDRIRNLIDLLPSNSTEGVIQVYEHEDLNRPCLFAENADSFVREVAAKIADDGFFLETKALFGKRTVTGFIRLNGRTIGVIGNNRMDGASRLSAAGCDKLSQFIGFCSRFSIPVLTLVDVDGFATDFETEAHFSTAAAKLVARLAGAHMPRINVIIGKSLGSCHALLNSHGLGAHFVFAWEGAEVGMMERARYRILYGDEVEAVEQGAVDKIIYPQDTRKYVIGALETLL